MPQEHDQERRGSDAQDRSERGELGALPCLCPPPALGPPARRWVDWLHRVPHANAPPPARSSRSGGVNEGHGSGHAPDLAVAVPFRSIWGLIAALRWKAAAVGDEDFPAGLYETLRTEGLARALGALTALTPRFASVGAADAPHVLARHLSGAVRRSACGNQPTQTLRSS